MRKFFALLKNKIKIASNLHTTYTQLNETMIWSSSIRKTSSFLCGYCTLKKKVWLTFDLTVNVVNVESERIMHFLLCKKLAKIKNKLKLKSQQKSHD